MSEKYLILVSIVITSIASCKKDKEEVTPQPPLNTSTLPEFYKTSDQGTSPAYTEIASNSSTGGKLSAPTDLDFHPTRSNELWVINEGTEATGGSTVMFSNAGLSNQSYDYRKDGNSWHFMSLPTSIAFGDNGNFATSTGVLDANHQGGKYTGPTLWPGDLSIYAIIGNPPTQQYNGSHLDMVHESPRSMGIANEEGNVYWVFDGYYGNICRYNFSGDHGPGQDYHGDGKVHRYKEVSVVRKPGVPSHMILDKATGWLYICDAGNERIIRLDTKSGTKKKNLTPQEPLAEYWEMQGAVWEVFADTNLQKPCGIDIKGNRLFVSDNATGEIIAYNTDTKSELARINTGNSGIMGIKIGSDGKVWYVNYTQNKIFRVDPN